MPAAPVLPCGECSARSKMLRASRERVSGLEENLNGLRRRCGELEREITTAREEMQRNAEERPVVG